MAKSRKVFAVHPGEILKTEFMEPMGVSAYELAKALNFPGIYEVARGDRAISADTAIRWKSTSVCPRSSGSIYRTITILGSQRVAESAKGLSPARLSTKPNLPEPAEVSVPTCFPDPREKEAAK
jgi:addiction module HigA family antidote